MKTRTWPATAILALFAVGDVTGQSITDEKTQSQSDSRPEWSGSFSVSTYLAQHARDFANPVVSADHDWLHLEARYNYEALKTGSLWVGYNFAIGEKLVLEATPMVGLVFGDSTGVAPGYTISLTYDRFELSTQGEFFFDAGTPGGNFFYNWSEISYAPLDWLRLGMVVDRTKVLGAGFDVRRGPLIGFSYDKVDFTTYWLDPGSQDATFVLAVSTAF
jgi:hypothetical protein